MTRDDMRSVLDRAGVPRASYTENYELGEIFVYVDKDFMEEAEAVLMNPEVRSAFQHFTVKRLWFWRRWFTQKLY